jgi:anaphase-promoting complex subunit 7
MTTAVALGVTPALPRARPAPRRASRARGPARSRAIVPRAGADDDIAKPSSASNSVLSALCPLLKVFSGGDAAAPRNRFLEVATSGFASISRLPFGVTVQPECAARPAERSPKKPIVLYEFEACPFCRRVRETATQLDLELVVKPCPKEASTHRDEAFRLGNSKNTFPFLVDENTNTAMSESEDICKYLWFTYGEGTAFPEAIVTSTMVTGWMPTLLRAGRGMTRYANAKKTVSAFSDDANENDSGNVGLPTVTLYNYEGNQFARLVREALCELEVPYILANAGKGSARRERLRLIDADASVPYLIDENTGVSLGESDKIVAYLFEEYGGYVRRAEA